MLIWYFEKQFNKEDGDTLTAHLLNFPKGKIQVIIDDHGAPS